MLSEGTRLESALRATDDLKLVAYVMAGHPNKKRSIEIGKRLASSGIAALEIGYRIGRLLVIREVLRQAPTGFSAATKCFGTEHEIRVAEFVARTLGAQATLWDRGRELLGNRALRRRPE